MRAVRPLLRALGRRVDVVAPTGRAIEGGTRLTLEPRRPLAAGWYMLEVEPGMHCIGVTLELDAPGSAPAYLPISSRSTARHLVKRVVRLERRTRVLGIDLDRPEATLRRVALAPLSTRFARSRLRRGGRDRDASPARRARAAQGRATGSLDALYADYALRFERHVRPIDYTEWRARHVRPIGARAAADAPRVELAISGERVAGETAALIATAGVGGVGLSLFDGAAAPSAKRFVLFLGTGTRVDPNLLPVLVGALRPNTVLCHADHDRLDADGERVDPAFKPDWNPEMLLARDYIGDAFLCRSDYPGCLDAARAGTPEARRELLVVAALELGSDQVVHVPDVLSSVDPLAEPAPSRAALLERVFARRGSAARALPGPLPGSAHVRWPLPAPVPSVEIVVPTRDRADVLRTCLESLLRLTDYPDYRVTVVDNDSIEPETTSLYDALAADGRVRVLPFAGPFNYSAINNRAVAASSADVVVLLNNDTEILHRDWLEQLVRLAIRPDVGCVGAKLYYSDGRIQHGGVIVGLCGIAGHAHRFQSRDADGYEGRLKIAQNLTAVTAACLAIRRELYESVGGLDADELEVAFNDVDLCLRTAAAGYRNVWTPAVELYHHESTSRGADDTPVKRARARRERDTMLRRWALGTFDDPAYNPNLTLEREDFGLAG